VVGRLRLDEKVMDMATFEALVLRREIAASPLSKWTGRDCRQPKTSSLKAVK
jgi:hypothetical protein